MHFFHHQIVVLLQAIWIFGNDETWSTAIQTTSSQPIDLVTVALHELGHSLGLRHSNVPGAIMNAFYSGSQRFLGTDDILGITQLYPKDRSITGSDIICDSNNYSYSINDLTANDIVNWTVSSNFQINNSTNSSVNVSAINVNNTTGWIEANINGIVVRKDIEIGIVSYHFDNANLTGNSSICGSQYYTYNISGFNHPCVTSVNWSVSPNLTIVSQNATSITVTNNPFNDQYAGLITANLPNSSFVIEKGVWVGVPSNDGLTIQKIGSYDLAVGQWTKLKANYIPLLYPANDPLNVTFEWQIPYSAISNYPDTAYKDVRPNNSGQLNIGVRAVCDCGNGEWKYRMFNVSGGNGNGGGVLTPVGGN